MDPIRRIFRKSEPDLAQELKTGDQQAAAHFGGPVDRQSRDEGPFVKVAWTAKLQSKLEADTARIQSAQVIAKALTGNQPMSVTGASHASMSLKQMLEDGKARMAAAHEKFAANMGKLNQATAALESLGDDVGSEADGLLASIGQFKNSIGGETP